METKLTAEGITKSYDGVKILENVSLELRDQEIVSLLGVSGAGKTTLFNVISGLSQPDCGHVFLKDSEITGQAGHVSYMLQKDLLLPYRSVVDNVALPLLLHGVPKKEARQKAGALFADFGLEGTQKKWPAQLSGGMRQRAALLRTYLSSEGVALLDEPFSALDTITKDTMHTWYLNVMQKIELSTLFITHDIDEAILLSDRIYVLAGRPGHMIAEMPVTEPRPRTRDFTLTETFLGYKRRIIELLKI
ncbi:MULTISPECIES: ABC transporter ATP-binding protein [Caproicibacterium]|uniref:ABC transporter ATP-binding protein n=1 Tax=Caproicibacterium argilliputei TaxID=3030016 RepID=A0AA97DBY9_9FIRM|nr:ABC transporter ATP-binding protein [Caproicibacterium argilliputei]WOC32770.1 ABC transporter ATP-binding protein [Caproicibacterium argilliputei]